jgi:MipA family protein
MSAPFRTSLSLVMAAVSACALADTPTAAPANASAATPAPAAEKPSSEWGLGLVMTRSMQPYREVGTRSRALPVLQYENSMFRVLGPMVDLKLPKLGPADLSLRAQYLDNGYKAGDSAFLEGMSERKGGFWLGLHADWQTPVAHLSAEWMSDAAGNSNGNHVKLVVDKLFPVGRFGFAPRLGLHWLDKKNVNYHYGVSASEARADRPGYEAKAALNTELGLRVFYGFAVSQSVFLDMSSTSLGSSIKDSPLVDRSRVSGVRLGYLKRF